MSNRVASLLFPMIGIAFFALLWSLLAANVPDLPGPIKTWEESKLYILQPLEKRGEMDQGIGLLAYYSLVRASPRVSCWEF